MPRGRLAAALALAILLPAAAQSEGFQGTFSGEGMILTLQPARDQTTGTLVFDGGFYAVSAEEADGELSGSFATDNGRFDFRAFFADDTLHFETNAGITYRLQRSSGSEAGTVGAHADAAGDGPAIDDDQGDSASSSADDDGATANGTEATTPAPPVPPAPSTPPTPSAPSEEPAVATPEAEPEDDGFERDSGLVGVWTREAIPGDTDVDDLSAGASSLELAVRGDYSFDSDSSDSSGRWRTEGSTLLLRPAGSDAWRPYCRYRVVASTLLCTLATESRQLWHRR